MSWPLSFFASDFLQIEQPLYWFRETQPLPWSFKEAKTCVQHCSALRIVSLQSQRETLWRASGRTNRKSSERTGGMIYNQQRELQFTGMRVDWRATGSIVETVRFILHASWKYNEQEPTTQQPTYRHPRMQAHNYECLQTLAATQIKWEHTHTQCILICGICQSVKSRVHILKWQTWTIREDLMEQFCLKTKQNKKHRNIYIPLINKMCKNISNNQFQNKIFFSTFCYVVSSLLFLHKIFVFLHTEKCVLYVSQKKPEIKGKCYI